MKKPFLVMALASSIGLLGGCAMSPPPGASYSPPAPTALPAAAPATFYRVTCWQPSLFGGYWRTEILSYAPPRPPTCSPPPVVYQPYGYGYPYMPYGYAPPFFFRFHLFGGRDWDDH